MLFYIAPSVHLLMMLIVSQGIVESVRASEMQQMMKLSDVVDDPNYSPEENEAGLMHFHDHSPRRQLDYPDYTIVEKYGFKWTYYTNTLMNGNQYIVKAYNLGSVAANEQACMERCLQDAPNSDGNTCMSIDWWIQAGKCHLSVATSCNPTASYKMPNGSWMARPNAFVQGRDDNNVVNFYEKVCACGISLIPGITTTHNKVFNSALTNVQIYEYTDVFTNSRHTICPITSCTVLQEDCRTALDSVVSTFVFSSSKHLYVSQTIPNGIAATNVCYQCTNGLQKVGQVFTLSQTMDCQNALGGSNSTSSLVNFNAASGTYKSLIYVDTSTMKTLAPFTTPSAMFANINSAACGGFVTCSLKAAGCAAPYTGSNVQMDGATFALTAKQNVGAGYLETLCVECANAAGATAQRDDWKVEQDPDPRCATSLGTATVADQSFPFDSSATGTTMLAAAAVISNTEPSVCPLTACTLHASNCASALPASLSPYITLDAAFAIKISQTATVGYAQTTFCMSCTNGQQTRTKTISVTQTHDCATQSTFTDLVSDVVIDYGASSSLRALSSYAEVSDFYTYTDAAVCGALTCELKAVGCSGHWSDTGIVGMNSGTFAVSVKQNSDAGYARSVCLKCSNGHVTKTHDNWLITQERNCLTALQGTARTDFPKYKEIAYSASAGTVTVATGSAQLFTNPFSATCGALTTCSLKTENCAAAYSGTNVHIGASAGLVTGSQNVDAGYDENVCVACANAAGGVATFFNLRVKQLPNCATAMTANSVAPKVYAYDSSLTATTVLSQTDAITSDTNKAAYCPITSCSIWQSGGSSALVDPFDSLLTIGAATPWTLKLSQTKASGYPNTDFCYQCTNGVQTLCSEIRVRQKINCVIALNSNSTSLIKDYQNPQSTHHAAYEYAASPQYKALSEYTASTALFENPNSGDCGGFTSCSLKPQGCSGTYSGRARMAAGSFALSVVQDTDAGYTETLCVACQNLAGSKTEHDNWIIHQVRNCATALVGAIQGSPPTDKTINYLDSASRVTQASGSAAFFTNAFSGECGAITACSLKAQGCSSNYSGNKLFITSSTGKVESVQNYDSGWTETVCIECQNAGGSKITHDNWKIYQKPNCQTLAGISLSDQAFDYNSALTSTTVFTPSQVFTNSKPSLCPIFGCTLTQSDCQTALVAPFDSLLSIESQSPWSLKISQTQQLGYQNVNVCYSCSNKDVINQSTEQVITKQITIRQKINCAIALNGNSTSSINDFYEPAGNHYSAFDYNSETQFKSLSPYTSSSTMFSNVNSPDCGGFTSCYPKPQGCSGTYSGRAKLDSQFNYGLYADQTVGEGYNETLCITCQNLAGSKVQHDNFKIQQRMICLYALMNPTNPQYQPIDHSNQLFNFSKASVETLNKKTIAETSAAFFTNKFSWACGPINSCSIMEKGCQKAYNNNTLTIDSTSGKITAQQNMDYGYSEEVCIKCQNSANSVITFDKWKVQQLSNCAVEKVIVNEKIGVSDYKPKDISLTISSKDNMPTFEYGVTYRSGQNIIENKNVTSIDISELKKLFKMARAGCADQINDWQIWNETLKQQVKNTTDIKFSQDGNSITINTDLFNLTETFYLKSVKFYGKQSAEAFVKININVAGCKLVRIKFNSEPPDEILRTPNYEVKKTKSGQYPIQMIQQMTSNTTTAINKKMNVAFVTEDDTNCPVVLYQISKVTNQNNKNKVIESEKWNKFISFSEKNGSLTVRNTSIAMKWNIWLSAVGLNSTNSGQSEVQNVVLHLYDPPVNDNQVAIFEVENDNPVQNLDGSLTINRYVDTYRNLTLFDYPKENDLSRYIIYYLPPTFESKDLPIFINITAGLDETFVKYDKPKNRIMIDKKNFKGDPSKIKACEALNVQGSNSKFIEVCPSHKITITLNNTINQSKPYYFNFVFQYQAGAKEKKIKEAIKTNEKWYVYWVDLQGKVQVIEFKNEAEARKKYATTNHRGKILYKARSALSGSTSSGSAGSGSANSVSNQWGTVVLRSGDQKGIKECITKAEGDQGATVFRSDSKQVVKTSNDKSSNIIPYYVYHVEFETGKTITKKFNSEIEGRAYYKSIAGYKGKILYQSRLDQSGSAVSDSSDSDSANFGKVILRYGETKGIQQCITKAEGDQNAHNSKSNSLSKWSVYYFESGQVYKKIATTEANGRINYAGLTDGQSKILYNLGSIIEQSGNKEKIKLAVARANLDYHGNKLRIDTKPKPTVLNETADLADLIDGQSLAYPTTINQAIGVFRGVRLQNPDEEKAKATFIGDKGVDDTRTKNIEVPGSNITAAQYKEIADGKDDTTFDGPTRIVTEIEVSAKELAKIKLPVQKPASEMTEEELDNEVFLDDDDDTDESSVSTSEDLVDDGGTEKSFAQKQTSTPDQGFSSTQSKAQGSTTPRTASSEQSQKDFSQKSNEQKEEQTKEKLEFQQAKSEAQEAVNNAAKAQKIALAKAQTKRLRNEGFSRTPVGYQWPDVDPELIETAAKKRILLQREKALGKINWNPKPPRMRVTPMDPTGKFKIDIDQPMMAPTRKLDQSIYNGGFELGVISENDGTKFKGSFGDADKKVKQTDIEDHGPEHLKPKNFNRNLAEKSYGTANHDDDANRLSFKPFASDHDENGMLLHIQFDNPETVSVMGEASIEMKIKELSIFKTKETARSLTNEAFTDGKPEMNGMVPPIIADLVEAEDIRTKSVESSKLLNYFNAGNFFLMLILGGTMRQLWGMVRSVQMLTFTTVVNVKIPINLFIFLRFYVYFAMMDVLQGRYLYKSNLHFRQEAPYNGAFGFFGFYDCNMINHSGSFFLILISIICFFLFKALLNSLACCCSKLYYARKLGIWAHEDSYLNTLGQASAKLFMESYFELTIFTVINLIAMINSSHQDNIQDYFSSPLEIASSVIVFMLIIIFFLYPIFGAVSIHKNQGKLEHKKVQVQLSPFLQGLKLNSYHASMYNVYFLARRFMTAFILVMSQNQPYFQCSTLVFFSLINFIYQIKVKPFELAKDNYIEIFNELIILVCSYQMCIFLNAGVPQDFLRAVGWEFMFNVVINILVNAIMMFLSHLLEGYSAIKRKRYNDKIIELCYIRLENLRKISKMARPNQFKFIQREIESYENIQIMKTWWPQYQWMKKNNLSLEGIQEHDQFLQLSRKMQVLRRVNDVHFSRQAIEVAQQIATLKIQEKRKKLAGSVIQQRIKAMKDYYQGKDDLASILEEVPVKGKDIEGSEKRLATVREQTSEQEESSRSEVELMPFKTASKLFNFIQKPVVDPNEANTIFNKELNQMTKKSLFQGVELQEDKFFQFQEFDELRKVELYAASKSEQIKGNSDLRNALKLETQGYQRKGMSKEEVLWEKKVFAQQYSLDFMIDENVDLQDEVMMKSIIHREATKTQEQKIEDLNLDSNLILWCDTVNGYMQAAFKLLSINKQFVRFFIKSQYKNCGGKVPQKKPFCEMLDHLFTQMFRNTDLIMDRKSVDISSLQQKFRSLFNPQNPHDVYKFLVSMINGIARETIDHVTIQRNNNSEKKNMDTYKYFEAGIANKCFGILSGVQFECGNGHLNENLCSHYFMNIHVQRYADGANLDLEDMIANLFIQSKKRDFCKECKKEVNGTSRRKLISLPKSLIIVVDRFNSKGLLKNLVTSFPSELDLNEHVDDDNEQSAIYSLSGFVSQDPLMLDYNVCIKNRQEDEDWVTFSKRGMTSATDETMFSRSSSNNAQILMYKLKSTYIQQQDDQQ